MLVASLEDPAHVYLSLLARLMHQLPAGRAAGESQGSCFGDRKDRHQKLTAWLLWYVIGSEIFQGRALARQRLVYRDLPISADRWRGVGLARAHLGPLDLLWLIDNGEGDTRKQAVILPGARGKEQIKPIRALFGNLV